MPRLTTRERNGVLGAGDEIKTKQNICLMFLTPNQSPCKSIWWKRENTG